MADRLLTSSCCVLHLAPTCRCICCRLPFVPRLAAAAAPVEPRPGPRGQAAWWRERQQQRWQQGDSCGSSRDCWHSRRYFTTQVCSSHWRWQGEALSGGGDARPLQSSSQLMQRGFDFPNPSLANHFVQHRLPACSAPPPACCSWRKRKRGWRVQTAPNGWRPCFRRPQPQPSLRLGVCTCWTAWQTSVGESRPARSTYTYRDGGRTCPCCAVLRPAVCCAVQLCAYRCAACVAAQITHQQHAQRGSAAQLHQVTAGSAVDEGRRGVLPGDAVDHAVCPNEGSSGRGRAAMGHVLFRTGNLEFNWGRQLRQGKWCH